MKQLLAIALMGAVFGGSALLSHPAQAGPNCTCRHSGGDIAEGQTACIKTPKGMGMARCERVLNNTSWKMLDVPCPFAQAETGFETLGPPLALPGDHPAQSNRVLSTYDILVNSG